ncbi:MAG: aconitase family protein, partial [Clostridia bacterium]
RQEIERRGGKFLFGTKVVDIKIKDGKVIASQGIIAGCAGGTYDNIVATSSILNGKQIGQDAFSLTVYPGSQSTNLALVKDGTIAKLIESGAILKPCFCGPCFGAGDVPCNNGFSIRHTTRNFERREGSKPSDNQIASVALMDARSIAATAANGGVLTSALNLDYEEMSNEYTYTAAVYNARIYNGYGKPDASVQLVFGPNITDLPQIEELGDNLALKVCSVINDAVTTTDELIPSGETSSYRSNPLRLAEFALSRKDPKYVGRSKAVRDGNNLDIKKALESAKISGKTTIGTVIFAVKPGDGSAREQAASCQRFLGGSANIAREYATKRYRSNLINWGMLPLLNDGDSFEIDDIIIVENIRKQLIGGKFEFEAKLVRGDDVKDITLRMDAVTDNERQIILDGSLINYYKNH